ncbi:hypothetical protein Q7P35_008967 [Cladosporium inversicolor]
MPRKVRLRTSRGASPDEQPRRYGLRKRTAHGTVPDVKNLPDTKHDTLTRETKRARTNTRNYLSASIRSPRNSARVSSVQGRVERNKNKLWLAEAIRKENDTQYLIEYKPVYEGAQSEISWQPKRYANAALLGEWKQHKIAVAYDNCTAEPDDNPNSTSRDDDAGHRSDLVEHGHRELAARLPLQEPYDADLKGREQHTTNAVYKKASAGFRNSAGDTLLTAPSKIVSEASGVYTPDSDVAVTEICDNNRHKGRHDCAPVTSFGSRDGFAPSPCDLQTHHHRPPKGDTMDNSSGKSSPRPGTSISTILSPAPCTLSDDNKGDESSTFVGEHSNQALPRVSTEVKVPKNSDVPSGPPGKLASAREQLRLFLRGPGRRRYRKSYPRSPPSP